MYTGDGKGKSTAAFGLALRARGINLRVHLIQFIKNKPSSETAMLEKIGVVVSQFGSGVLFGRPISQADTASSRRGLGEVRRQFVHAGTDVLILDEINIALSYALVDENEFHGLLDLRPQSMEVICTGRGAPQSLIRRADLVTEMQAVKHYFQAGVPARMGIEK